MNSKYSEFVPQSILALRKYSLALFYQDLFAGITVGIVALPLALAFAIASGVPPEKGLFTAVVAGFLISALGGSRFQVGGPTGAFVVIIYDIISKYGYLGLARATFLAGLILIVIGLSKLGSFIKFIPFPVTTGFTTGIAVIIASTQVKDFLGLKLDQVPANFIEKWIIYFNNFQSSNFTAILLGVFCLLLLILQRKFFPKLPGAIIVIAIASFVNHYFNLSLETIGLRFGSLPSHLPFPSFDFFNVAEMIKLAPEAFTIAMLAGIESLLSAVVADTMSGTRHSSNCELVAQGIANISSIIFGGIPATGAIARTATNIKSGAQTPLAGMIHALTLLLMLLFLAPLATSIPLVSLAAILLLVCWNMAEIHVFARLFKSPKSDVVVLLTVFLITVFIDLVSGVAVGMVLAVFLFMKRMSEIANIIIDTEVVESSSSGQMEEPQFLAAKDVPENVEVLEIRGPLFFGVADKLRAIFSFIEKKPKVIILRMHHVPVIDATGLYALEDFYQQCKKNNIVLLLSAPTQRLQTALIKIGLWDKITEKNICSSIYQALNRARVL